MKRSAVKNTKIIFLISVVAALIFCPARLMAQIDPTKFGEGAKEKTEPWPNNDGGKSTRTIVTDKCGKLRQSRLTTVMELEKMGPNFTHIKVLYRDTKFTEYDCKERPVFESTTKTANGIESEYSSATYSYNDWGDKFQIDGLKRETNKEGKTKTQKYDPIKKDWVLASLPENSETFLASAIPPVNDCPCSDQNCQSAFNIYGGPGILLVDLGGDRKSFFGGQLVANVNITKRVSIGVNAGIYSTKFGMSHVTRSLMMIDGQYTFGDPDNCDRKLIPDVQIVAGLIHETYINKKGNGAIYGAGAGGVIKITRNIGIKAQAEALAVKWKNDDETTIDYRASVGIELSLGHRPSNSLRKSNNINLKNH